MTCTFYFALLVPCWLGSFADVASAFLEDDGVGLTTPIPTTERAETIRVLSYNIHMWQISVEDLTGIIRKSKADIVGLNEAWNGDKNNQIAKKLGYNIVYGGQNVDHGAKKRPHTINGHYMPQVLLTRFKVVSSRTFNAVESKNHKDYDPEVPIYRGGTLAVLETDAGQRVAVFVLHLHPWGDGKNEKMIEMRLAELNGILAKMKPYKNLPRILLGDFNSLSHRDVRSGWKVSRRLELGGYQDLYRTVHPDAKKSPGLTCGPGRIDYVFASKHFHGETAKVLVAGRFGSKGYRQSDHLALFGRLTIDSKAP